MAVAVTHTFVSPVADLGDPNEVGPDEWNAAHTISGISAFAQTYLDDATAADTRTTLGLGTGDSPTFTGLTLTGSFSVVAATITSLSVTGTTTLSTLTVTGTASLAAASIGSLTVTGTATVSTLTVTGTASIASLTVTGTATVSVLTVVATASISVLTVMATATISVLTVVATASISTLLVSGTMRVAATASMSTTYFGGNVIAPNMMFPPQGRLTLVTATPVMNVTVTATASTIYYTPYVGNKIPIYDGTNMVPMTFSELSAAISDTTKSPAAIGASKVNDWFVWNDAGTLRIGHGPDWTSDTARSAGTALVMVNGILLNSVAITNGPDAQRGTYVGTTRSNASSLLNWTYGALAAGGTAAFFGVWNAYNRVDVHTMVRDSTDSWTYGLTTPRASNNSTAMRISFVTGLEEDSFFFEAVNYASGAAGSNAGQAGVGIDVTNAFSGIFNGGVATLVSGAFGMFSGTFFGFHFAQDCEAASTASNVTFFGDAGAPTLIQTGLIGQLRM